MKFIMLTIFILNILMIPKLNQQKSIKSYLEQQVYSKIIANIISRILDKVNGFLKFKKHKQFAGKVF
jgi:hypothetical protein